MILEDTGKNILNRTSFYRYEGLEHAVQCPSYIKADRRNIGCRFPQLTSSDYKDFFICVNGTSQFKAIRPSYFIFQLQNLGEFNLKMLSSLGHL